MGRYPLLSVPDDINDPYKLHDPGYDPNGYYCSAGIDSSSPRIRISNEHLGEIAAIVAGKDVPEYRTVADFVRNAIRHQLVRHAERQHDPALMKRLKLELAREQADQRLAQSEKRQATLGSLRKAFDRAMGDQSRQDCWATIESAQGLMDEDSPEDPFQEDLRVLLDRMVKQAEGL